MMPVDAAVAIVAVCLALWGGCLIGEHVTDPRRHLALSMLRYVGVNALVVAAVLVALVVMEHHR